MLTIKAIHELIEKEYPFKSEAKDIRDQIVLGRSLGQILKSYPKLGYGIEHIKIFNKCGNSKCIGYINVGDSYTNTLMRNMNGNIIISSIGDFIERLSSNWTAW